MGQDEGGGKKRRLPSIKVLVTPGHLCREGIEGLSPLTKFSHVPSGHPA